MNELHASREDVSEPWRSTVTGIGHTQDLVENALAKTPRKPYFALGRRSRSLHVPRSRARSSRARDATVNRRRPRDPDVVVARHEDAALGDSARLVHALDEPRALARTAGCSIVNSPDDDFLDRCIAACVARVLEQPLALFAAAVCVVSAGRLVKEWIVPIVGGAPRHVRGPCPLAAASACASTSATALEVASRMTGP